jgi:hypothetical protein
VRDVGVKGGVGFSGAGSGACCQLRRLGARGGAGKPTLLSLKN